MPISEHRCPGSGDTDAKKYGSCGETMVPDLTFSEPQLFGEGWAHLKCPKCGIGIHVRKEELET